VIRPIYRHPVRNCTFLGQTGPTVFFPQSNAVDHYLWRRGDGEMLLQRGSSVHYAQFACLVERADPVQWRETIELLVLHNQENSAALAIA